MLRCTKSRLPSDAARLAPNGREPFTSTVRRLGGAVALAALLMALPAPALAAPAEGSPAFSGVVVLDWIQGFLARFGFGSATVSEVEVRDTPSAIHHRLGSDMEPNGVLSNGAGYDEAAGETLFLGSDMEPNG